MLLAIVKVLHGDAPELPLEHRETPLLLGAHGKDTALDAHPAPASAPHGADDDRAAAVDVAVQQGMQRDDGIVVLGRGMHEVDDQAGLLARVATCDAPDALLVDALGRCGARCTQTVARGLFHPSARSCALISTSMSPRS